MPPPQPPLPSFVAVGGSTTTNIGGDFVHKSRTYTALTLINDDDGDGYDGGDTIALLLKCKVEQWSAVRMDTMPAATVGVRHATPTSNLAHKACRRQWWWWRPKRKIIK